MSSKQGGVETRYLLDEGITANVWEEYATNGTVQASYVYGNDLITQTQAGQTSYYLVDGLGSTRLLTDAAGQVLNSYGYEAFGQTVSQTGSASNKYQYAGEQFDAALGDYYLRQRFYDTSSGRFGRMDTYETRAGNLMGINKYIYGNSNPASLIDPTGFYSQRDGYDAEEAVEVLYEQSRPIESHYTQFGRQIKTGFGKWKIPGPLSRLKPDILNFAGFMLGGRGVGFDPGPGGMFNEIKPLSANGIRGGIAKLAIYSAVLQPFNVDPDPYWLAPVNLIGGMNGPQPITLKTSNRAAIVFNLGGIIFYTDDTSPRMKNALATATKPEDAWQLLLIPSNSSVNELAKGLYISELGKDILTGLTYSIIAGAMALALYTARYAM